MKTQLVLSTGVVGIFFLSSGCAGWQADMKERMKQPHPMESQFGHVLFNGNGGLYPSLAAAAPAKEQTPRRGAEGERPTDPAVASASTEPRIYEIQRTQPGTAIPTDTPPTATAPIAMHPHTVIPEPHGDLPAVPSRPKAPKQTEDRGLTIEPLEPWEPTQEEPAPAPPQKGLGDGSIASEMVAASQRMVGFDTDFDERSFLIRVMQIADVDVNAAKGEELVKAVYAKLNAGNKVFGPAHVAKPGDLVFFHNTRDRDEDGRADDWFTMAGVVERVDGDGTITLIGYARDQIRRLHLNLAHPTVGDDSGGKTLNSMVRAKRLEDRPFTAYRAGELFAAFARL
ncbi:MAG: hypothetical protein ACI9WU_003506 [Myxococcota bacterium]